MFIRPLFKTYAHFLFCGVCLNLACLSAQQPPRSAYPANAAPQSKEIAQNGKTRRPPRDDRDTLKQDNFRAGDWDYKSNWRYNHDAFYRGETQGQVVREELTPGAPGIGYDGDEDYGRYNYNYNSRPNPSTYVDRRSGYYYTDQDPFYAGDMSNFADPAPRNAYGYDQDSSDYSDRRDVNRDRYNNSGRYSQSYDRSSDRYNTQDRSSARDRSGSRTDSNRNGR